MNILSRKLLSTGYMNGNPFSAGSTGGNIFDNLASRKAGNNNGNMQVPPQNSGGMPNGAQSYPSANSTQPNSGNAPSNIVPNQGGSPLDNFAPQSHNAPNGSPAQQSTPQQQQPQPTPQQQQEIDYFNQGLDSYSAYTGNQSYIGDIDEAVATKALQGDMASLKQLLNSVAQSAVANSAFMSSRIAGKGVQSQLDAFGSKVPNMIKEHQMKSMFADDKVMNHPAMRPMVETAMQSMRSQFPEATPTELQAKVREYMQTMAQVFQGQDPNQQQEPEQDATNNLSNFFNG